MRDIKRRKIVKRRVIGRRIIVFPANEKERDKAKTVAVGAGRRDNFVNLKVLRLRNIADFVFRRLRFAPNFLHIITSVVKTKNPELRGVFDFKTVVG